MSHEKKAMFVEAKVLEERYRGSYEERLQLVEHSINENRDMFGEGEVALLATYSAHVDIVNESGDFFTVRYDFNHGDVKLGEPTPLDIDVVVESDIATKGVTEFFENGSIAEGLRGCLDMATTTLNQEALSPMVKAERRLSFLFSENHEWVKILRSKADQLSSMLEGEDYGGVELDIHPVFEGMTEELNEDWRDIVTEELVNVERRCRELLTKLDNLFEDYKEVSPGVMLKDEMAMRVLMFEGFTFDYLDNMWGIVNYISETIKESKQGCVACAAMIHDEIAKKSKEIGLGAKFVHAVLSQIEK